MRMREFAMFAALGVAAFGLSSVATAEEEVVVAPDGRVIAFSDVGAKFNVSHDPKLGTMTFRLADDSKVKLTDAPTVTLKTAAGPKDVTLVAVQGQPNAWTLSHEALRAATIDGSMKIVVDGRPYTTTLVTSAAGGRRNVMAAAWVMPIDFDPPKIAAVIDGCLVANVKPHSCMMMKLAA